MDTQFRCENEGRRIAVWNQKNINGIDYLEVEPEDQTKLRVFFIHSLPGFVDGVPPGALSPPVSLSPPASAQALRPENFLIEGGQRITNVKVKDRPYAYLSNSVEITVNEPGDFSIYTLRIVTSATNLKPPEGFDPQLSTVKFSFKVSCLSEFDCKTETICPPERLSEPEISYLAKDYSSFRRLILDRLSVIMPDWREDNPADLQMALVELLAYAGDHLSYYQDAVATEAYLGTARKRTSVRRHARLVDYFMHDGCNSRVWVFLEVEEGGGAENQPLKAGTPLLTGRPDSNPVIAELGPEETLNGHLVFETMHDLTLRSAHNRIRFYTWSDSRCCLPRGSTRATLLNDPPLFLDKEIKDNDEYPVLVFEEVLGPTTGAPADADPNKRHAIRLKNAVADVDPLDGTPVIEIEWHEEDALPFPLCLSAIPTDGEDRKLIEVSVARGNIVLADHGRSVQPGSLEPKAVPDKGEYRPVLERNDITFAVPYVHETDKNKVGREKGAKERAAVDALRQEPREALPSVTLNDGGETWSAQRDLLGSDRFAPEFVVEVEQDLSAHLRFGDDVLGKKPSAGTEFEPEYRVGNGRAGNVGAEAIARIVTKLGGISKVRNPMPAVGGTDPETMEEVRQFAPQAFRIQERAITETDYAEVTERHPEVQKAAARFRWTGSWHTVFIAVDRKGGREVDSKFEDEIRSHLGRYRIAGYDLEIDAPRFVALEIEMNVCVKPDYFRSDVKETLLDVFSRYDLENGQRGFFHPDNFTFGTPVYLSQLYERATDVAGVASVVVNKFNRWGKKPNKEIENGVLTTEGLEIVRLDNDKNFQENGKIEFTMRGGL